MVSSKTFVSSQGESNNRGREKEAPVIHRIYDCLSLSINLQLLVAHYFKSIYVTSNQFTMIGLSALQINLLIIGLPPVQVNNISDFPQIRER